MTSGKDFWHRRRVLVTGAGGFIGSHLAEQLAKDGAEVRAFVHYRSSGSHGWLEESPQRRDIEFVAGDVCDAETVRRAMQSIDTVFHLAALIGIPYSYVAVASYLHVNVLGTMNILQAALNAGVRRLVHTSTSEVYGTATEMPITEAHGLQAQSPYAASKVGADKLAESFHRSFRLPIVTVRPFNTFGPRQSLRAVIPTIIAQVLRSDAVRLGHLTPTRDFTYVTDTAAGLVKAGEADEAIGKEFNLGTGRDISIGDLAKLIMRLADRELPVVSEAARERPKASEVERLCASAARAHKILAWRPRQTLEQGLTQTLAWIEQNLDRYKEGYGV